MLPVMRETMRRTKTRGNQHARVRKRVVVFFATACAAYVARPETSGTRNGTR